MIYSELTMMQFAPENSHVGATRNKNISTASNKCIKTANLNLILEGRCKMTRNRIVPGIVPAITGLQNGRFLKFSKTCDMLLGFYYAKRRGALEAFTFYGVIKIINEKFRIWPSYNTSMCGTKLYLNVACMLIFICSKNIKPVIAAL